MSVQADDDGVWGLTRPTANVKLFFSGRARSTNLLTEAEDVSLGNNLAINPFFSIGLSSVAWTTSVGVGVDALVDVAEAAGSEGFNVCSATDDWEVFSSISAPTFWGVSG